MDNECLATLRHFLVEMQGLDPAAAEVIVRRNWAPGSQSGLNCVWKLWLKHCDLVGISFSSPTVAEFINFLQQVSDGTYRAGNKQGVSTSAGWVRSVRSGISSMLTLMTSAPRLGEDPLVTTYVASIIKQDILDRNRPGVRYEDTWDATLVFDYWMEQPPTAELSYSSLLDKALSLSRVQMCCRSSDLQTLWFGERQNGKTLEFLFDGDSVLTGVKIRYFNPKTGRYLAFSSGFTAWETFLVNGDYPPELDLATVLYALHQRVVLRGDTAETPSVFLSVRKGDGLRDRPKGLYHALKADTLASRMKSVMLKSGVPADFKAHSARAAGGALLKTKGFSDDAIMDRMRLRSKYIYKKHYKRTARPVAEYAHPRAEPAGLQLDASDPSLAGSPLAAGSAGDYMPLPPVTALCPVVHSPPPATSPTPPAPPSPPAVRRSGRRARASESRTALAAT